MTTAGRIIACFLMIGGVGLFGSFAAYVSSLYVSEESEDDDRQHRASREMIRHLNSRMEELTEEVRALRAELQRPPTTGASGEEDKVEDAEGGDARMRRHLTGSNKPDQ
ncbi:two pore domain potassium channel family protein [Kushneria phosphatilytica]|uniref:two pore domain potassium channel family protein n=1 Tax=Kushneria phosphatilytica TaxID=657387 RepID=UPI0008D90500|nr:two pore domain potassium channel family protein [Kushneria phosphatilytica]OHV07691.1 hypothetical protein BH688_16005 [Kushneria phosphatilytica]